MEHIVLVLFVDAATAAVFGTAIFPLLSIYGSLTLDIEVLI